MTDRTFTFEQVKQIYEAGIRRGESQQSAYEWGCSAGGSKWDDAIEIIVDIVNAQVPVENHYDTYKVVEGWFKNS